MTDAVLCFPPGQRLLDANGEPLASGSIEFYVGGTSFVTPLEVFSAAGLTGTLGTSIDLDAGGYPTSDGNAKTLVYTGSDPWAVVIKDSTGVIVARHDNIKGALDTSDFLTDDDVVLESPVVSTSSDLSLSATHKGKLIVVNCTGASRSITLPSALVVGDGYRVGIRHAGTANQVKIVTTSSQTIAMPGVAHTALALTDLGETVWLACDGAGWHVDSYSPPICLGGRGIIVVADRLSAPPVSPSPGAYYIVTSSPTGDWSTYAEHDLVRADGQGTWKKQTLPNDSGILAYVQDEDTYYGFTAAAWVTHSATQALMEAATSLVSYVTPGTQKHHPAHPKAWGLLTISGGTPTLAQNSGVSSVTDNGSGDFTLNFSASFSSATAYIMTGDIEPTSVSDIGYGANIRNNGRGANSVRFTTAVGSGGGAITDPRACGGLCVGDQ